MMRTVRRSPLVLLLSLFTPSPRWSVFCPSTVCGPTPADSVPAVGTLAAGAGSSPGSAVSVVAAG